MFMTLSDRRFGMKSAVCLLSLAAWNSGLLAAEPVPTARPIPLTRPEMKQLLEDMKQRPLRIPLPDLTDKDRAELGERADSYEARLRYHYMPAGETSVFGGARPPGAGQPGQPRTGAEKSQNGAAAAGNRDFTRNADEKMTLSYPFKTRLFWIVSRTNNCQYCLGHQEQKLSAVGMTDDQIAALDSNWSLYSPAEQAAFAYARKLTYEPDRLSDADIDGLRKHYTDLQILEMTTSIAGNNAINRWKEGTGVPQSKSGANFFRRGEDLPKDRPLPVESFLTPTSADYEKSVSQVATYDSESAKGKTRAAGISHRAPLEDRAAVEAALDAARRRKSRLPMLSAEEARTALGDRAPEGTLPNWMRLMANFANEARGRIPSLTAITDSKGDLTPLQKAQVSWIIARQDRAWYATGVVQKRLRQLGQTDDQIHALDGNWEQFSAADRTLFRFARHLAATPIALTDQDVAEALSATSPRHVVQLINFVTSRAYFDRVTEAAGLPLEE